VIPDHAPGTDETAQSLDCTLTSADDLSASVGAQPPPASSRVWRRGLGRAGRSAVRLCGGVAGQGAGRGGSPAPSLLTKRAAMAAPNMGKAEAAGRRHGAGWGQCCGAADGRC
jgi:hypothetical protein